MLVARRLPDLLTGLRIGLIPVLSIAVVAGNGRVAGFGLVLAGATDYLDGLLARRLGVAGTGGARFDALADGLLMVGAFSWLAWLHPDIVTGSPAIVAPTLTLWLAAVRFAGPRRLHGVTPKVAGGCLYGFAVFTLVSGVYEPLLLALAAGALMVSSAEALLMTISDAIASTRNARSHAPQAEKLVGSSAAAITSMATIAAHSARE